MNKIIYAFTIIIISFLYQISFASESDVSESYLNLSLEELSKVKITTAGKKLESISDIPASVVIVSKEEIQKYGFKTLEEILEHITGLYMIDDYYWLGSVNYGVRGFFTNEPFNNIYLMVNDVNQMEEYSRGAPLTKVNVPVEAINHIEIVRGPMSVIYGSGAFMGAINIITNNTDESMVSVTGGSLSNKKAFIQINKNVDAIRFALAASVLSNDGLDIPYSNLTSNPKDQSGKTLLESYGTTNDATTKNQLSENRIYIGGNLKFDNFTFDVSFTSNKNGMLDGQPSLGNGNYFINKAFIMFGQYEVELSDRLTYRQKFTYSSYSDYIRYNQDYINSNKGSNQISSFVESEANFNYKVSTNFDLLLGLYNRYTDEYQWGGDYIWGGANFKDFITTIESPFMNNAGFLQFTYNPIRKLSVIGGLRIENSTPFTLARFNDFDTASQKRTYEYDYNTVNIIPRIGLIYKFNENSIVKALYGQAIKQPSLASIQPYVLHPEWQTLKPSEITTYELNYLNSITGFMTTNISLFYNRFNNLVVRRDVNLPDGSLNIQSTNDGQMSSVGFELSFLINPIENLIIDISGTYQNSHDESAGKSDIEIGYSPSLLMYLKMSYNMFDYLTIGTTYRYVGAMESYYDNTSAGTGRIGASSPAYAIWDLNFLIDDFWKGTSINLKIRNLLDSEIKYPTTYANSVWDKGTFGFGRLFYLTFGYKFNL